MLTYNHKLSFIVSKQGLLSTILVSNYTIITQSKTLTQPGLFVGQQLKCLTQLTPPSNI